MDWYLDKNGMKQYNPKVTSQSNCGENETYIGATTSGKNKDGTIDAFYRSDGSIYFYNETAAYNRLVKSSKANGNREEMGILLENGSVLVTPNYKNLYNKATPEMYKYSWKNGNIVDSYGKMHKTRATIHTHFDLRGDAGPSILAGEDVDYFSKRTRGKAFMTIGYDNKIHAYWGRFYPESDFTPYPGFPNLTIKKLLQGFNLNKNEILGYTFQ